MTFWGLTDQLSWRSTHNPLIFNSDFSEKLGAAAVANPEKWLGVRKPITDTSRLEAIVEQAEDLDQRAYTAKSAAKVKAALHKAEHVLAESAPQRAVNDATTALTAAIAQLQRR